jgi:hypothetical protein
VSEPSGKSFNDNMDKYQVERLVVDIARSLSYTLLEAGRNARIDNTDVKDAFKNIPAKTDDLQLKGFMVEGKFFIELRMIFGACTALTCLQILLRSLRWLKAESPQETRQKRVDDQPIASPATLDWGEKFVASYKRICSELNLELSDDCSD